MDLGTMSSENQLQTTLDLINQLRLILLVFIGFISIIGTIDKFLPGLFPAYLKGIQSAKASSSNSRFFRLLLSFLELLSIVVWKFSSALFKFLVSLATLIVVLLKKILLPFMHKATKKLEDTSKKIENFSEEMERKSAEIEELSYNINDDLIREEAKKNKTLEF
jgi:hypothetical protein